MRALAVVALLTLSACNRNPLLGTWDPVEHCLARDKDASHCSRDFTQRLSFSGDGRLRILLTPEELADCKKDPKCVKQLPGTEGTYAIGKGSYVATFPGEKGQPSRAEVTYSVEGDILKIAAHWEYEFHDFKENNTYVRRR